MTDYLDYNGMVIPVVKIGRGSSNFFSNLVRCYIKNYPYVNVKAKADKINLAIWVIYQLKQEFSVQNIQVFCCFDGLYLSFDVIRDDEIGQLQIFEEDPNISYVKVGQKGDMDSLCRIVNKNNECALIAAGNSCYTLFQLLMCTYSNNFVSNEIEVMKTYDHLGKEKACVVVYIYKAPYVYDETALFGVQGEEVLQN